MVIVMKVYIYTNNICTQSAIKTLIKLGYSFLVVVIMVVGELL